jgi:hypothetical protein
VVGIKGEDVIIMGILKKERRIGDGRGGIGIGG